MYDAINPNSKVYPFTWIELFYIAAYDTCSDKTMNVSRQPIEDYNSIVPMRINIIPCEKYKKYVFNNKEYPRYPLVKILMEDTDNLRRYFVDTMRLNNSYLAGFDADFDGDQMTGYGNYSKEANEEAEKRIHSISNFVDNRAQSSTREFGEIVRSTLFALTITKEELKKM